MNRRSAQRSLWQSATLALLVCGLASTAAMTPLGAEALQGEAGRDALLRAATDSALALPTPLARTRALIRLAETGPGDAVRKTLLARAAEQVVTVFDDGSLARNARRIAELRSGAGDIAGAASVLASAADVLRGRWEGRPPVNLFDAVSITVDLAAAQARLRGVGQAARAHETLRELLESVPAPDGERASATALYARHLAQLGLDDEAGQRFGEAVRLALKEPLRAGEELPRASSLVAVAQMQGAAGSLEGAAETLELARSAVEAGDARIHAAIVDLAVYLLERQAQ